MASIKISDLNFFAELDTSGYNLFVDSESFLDELSESDLVTINGGYLFPYPPQNNRHDTTKLFSQIRKDTLAMNGYFQIKISPIMETVMNNKARNKLDKFGMLTKL